MSETTYTGTGKRPGLRWVHAETTTGVSGVVSVDKQIADLRAQLAAAQAEVERLRGIIRKAEWITDVDDDVEPFCGNCGANQSQGHDGICPFYQWETK